MAIQISVSVLNSDLSKLGDEIKRADLAGADMIHLDVMDGIFVENLTFGNMVAASARPYSDKPFDTHLMVVKPQNLIEKFAKAGSDIITFHLESDCDPYAVIEQIKRAGCKAGISIKPDTPAQKVLPFIELVDLVLVMTVFPGAGGQAFLEYTLDTVRAVKQRATELKKDMYIEVDGGINNKTAPAVIEAGANLLVSGSYLFNAQDMKVAMDSLRG
jgi:ribulose-phosphate 3-epimerase